jgi:hypothetical protein
MDASNNSYIKDANRVVGWVWYNGSDMLRRGEAVCFDIATGTATAVNGRRQNQVVRPTTSTNLAFAGVSERDYPARDGGQMIEINMPGSKGVMVALGVDTVINTGVLAFTAGSGSAGGRFVAGKKLGRGAAIPRQTVTALLEDGKTGTWSLATDGKTLTMTATAGLAAGDTVVLLSSEAEDATKKVTPGKYTIASITNATVLVLTASAVADTPVAAITCTGYAYTGNPCCQADLLIGDEAGGAEFVTAINAGVVGLPYMVGGITYLCATDISADADVTFAQGTLPGETKVFICLGTVGTSDYTIDLATGGFQIDGSTALAEINAIDAAGDAAYLQFNGAKWHCLDVAGGAAQA